MKDYEKASNLIREMEKTLSLNPKASIDTLLRKLQSVMRNNVSTNYGKRADLVKLLEESGAKNLLNKLAGQSLSSGTPRGLSRMIGAAGTLATGGTGLAALGGLVNPLTLAPMVAGFALQSPRLMGEVAHAGAQVANALAQLPARNALMAGYQTRGAP